MSRKNHNPAKIMIVDDVADNIEALVDALEPLNLDFLTFTNPFEALEKITQLQGDLVTLLLDVQMPELDGFQLAQKINGLELETKPPIIFFTAIHRDEDHVAQGYYSGAVDYLSKPININILRAKISVFKEIYTQNKCNIELSQELCHTVQKLEEANDNLSSFAYVVAHDLKAPVRQMSAFIQALKEQKEEEGVEFNPNVMDTYLARVDTCAHRINRTIDDILEYARYGLSKINPSEITLSKLFDRAEAQLELSIKENAAQVRLHGETTLRVDPNKMALVFQNLIQNSLKYRKLATIPQIDVHYEFKEGRHLIEFRDNGIGIDQQFHETIFTFMKRLHSQDAIPGTGIGLSTCEKIIASHFGKIWVESTPGEGASFFVSLPMSSNDN